jgi:aldehyde:ferredoxin oxidoreductase
MVWRLTLAEFGYAGKILKVDLSDGDISRLATADYADRFLGGRGIAAKIYWDMVPPQTGALDPENCFICASGPVAGFTRLAGCRWQICGKSSAREPEAFTYANLGDSWGTMLKYAGYDGLVVQGKADKPVYLFIHDGQVEIRDASPLWGKYTFEANDSLKAELGNKVSVLTIGPAAENLVSFATVLAGEGASGSGGLGAVMGSKMLKAIAVAGDKRPTAAEPERLRNLADRLLQLIKGPVPALDWVIPGRTRKQTCYGCGIGCSRQSYTDETGRRFKSFCQAIDAYRRPAEKYYDGWTEVILLAMRLFDGYGLDTAVMQAMIEWMIRCHKEGLLKEEETGLPLSKIGSSEFIEAITRKIALKEGFGELLAQGTIKTAEAIGGRAKDLIGYSVLTSANEVKDYDPRLILHNALLVATEPRRPIQQLHEVSTAFIRWLDWHNGVEGAFLSSEAFPKVAERFWGSAAAADFSTYEGKALASKKIQDRTHAKESLVLCDLFWPIICSPDTEDHVGDPTMESQVLSAITGREMDEVGLNEIGERIFNLQRAILMRQGWGGRDGDRLLDYLHEEPIQYLRFDRECVVLGKNGEVTTRKGAVVEREAFERMKSEYYELRGWDVESGLQTKTRLEELQLGDVASDLETRGLLKKER